MGSRQRKPKCTAVGRFARGRRLDRNPLRRTGDRAETVMLAVVVIAFLVLAPLAALTAGAWAHAAAQRAETAQAASRWQVTAVIVTVPEPDMSSADLASVTEARWTAPDGTVVTREMNVPDGMNAGATLRLWTTSSGQLTSHPLNRAQVQYFWLLGTGAGVAAVALVLALAGVAARWALDRRRMAAWAAAWQSTGPRWTTRT